jgi:hypothetical protein
MLAVISKACEGGASAGYRALLERLEGLRARSALVTDRMERIAARVKGLEDRCSKT